MDQRNVSAPDVAVVAAGAYLIALSQLPMSCMASPAFGSSFPIVKNQWN